MFGGTMKVAGRVLEEVSTSRIRVAVVMIGSTEEGCGGYGRVVVDPWEIIDVRMFGWPILVPGGEHERPGAVASMARLGFVFNGVDWLWHRRFVPGLVPVAAHAAARALAEAWSISEGEVDAMVDVHLLGLDDLEKVADGDVCELCGGACTRRETRSRSMEPIEHLGSL